MWLVVGLGNPGREYANNRHNVGFMAVEELAGRVDATGKRRKFSGELQRASLPSRDEEVWLLQPQTYMNRSGDSVQPCAAFYKIPIERIIVIHDELDLPFGTQRIKWGGGHAGHNGLRSIMQRLGGTGFVRIRVGIGRPPASFRGQVADYVLGDFSASESEQLPKTLEIASKSVLDIATRGAAAAMEIRNRRTTKKP